MKKLTQSFLISVAILSISCIGAMDEPYRDKGGSAASKIYPYGGQGSRSPYSSPTIMAQLEEGEKAWTSKPPASQPARSQSAEPLHIPSASSAPKLPAEVTTLQPVGGAAPTVAQKFVEPPLVRVASEGIDLSRSWSGSNLSGSVSSSPMVFEHVSVPQSVEVLYNNRIAKQPDQSRLLNRIHPEFEKWCADRIAFWQVYKATQQRLKLKELLLEKKKAAAAQALQAAGQSESSENQSYSAYLSNILVTTPAQHADSIRRTEEKIRRAKDDFERLQNQAKAMHPQCSQEQLDRFAFTPLNPRQPYFSRPTEIVKVFTHSPLDQIIAISMLEGFSDILPPVYRVKLPFPNRNKRLEEVNEALNVLWTIYQKDLLQNVQGWLSVSSWVNWHNLNKEEGPLIGVVKELQKRFPFVSLARLERDTSTYQGLVLAWLNKDERGKALWQGLLKSVKVFKDPIKHGLTTSPDARRVIAEQYQNLPKHFHDNGMPVLPLQLSQWSDSAKVSFENVYTGLDVLILREEEQDNMVHSFSIIKERKFIFKHGSEEPSTKPFVPAKDFIPSSADDSVVLLEHSGSDEYSRYMAELISVSDCPAYETPIEETVPNPLVEKWKKTPKKFARMAREFPSLITMEFHRNNWFMILQELHARKPIMIGFAKSGLTRPIEARPDGESLVYAFDPSLSKRYKEAFNRHKILFHAEQSIMAKLAQTLSKFSYLPPALEFVRFTKHSMPPRTNPQHLQGTAAQPLSLVVDNMHLQDTDLLKTHRMSTGRVNIFALAASLDLSVNELVNPPFGSHFTALTDLNLSRNHLTSVDCLKELWPQLISLKLTVNEISDVPFLNCAKLPLLCLDISSNQLTSVHSIAQFTNLRELNVGGNVVRRLMPLHSLVHLIDLGANNCGLQENWDTVIPSLTALKALNVNNNKHLLMASVIAPKGLGFSDSASNNRKFNEKFPSLEVLHAEGRELKAEPERRNASGTVTHLAKPIRLGDLNIRLKP